MSFKKVGVFKCPCFRVNISNVRVSKDLRFIKLVFQKVGVSKEECQTFVSICSFLKVSVLLPSDLPTNIRVGFSGSISFLVIKSNENQ